MAGAPEREIGRFCRAMRPHRERAQELLAAEGETGAVRAALWLLRAVAARGWAHGAPGPWAAVFDPEGEAEPGPPPEWRRRLEADLAAWEWRLEGECGPGVLTPDALAGLAEESLDRRASGSYYTGGDVARYLCEVTVLPWLLEALPAAPLQRLAALRPARYLRPALRAPEPLPCETEAETAARRARCRRLVDALERGALPPAAWIAENLDLRRLLRDAVAAFDAATLEPLRERLQRLRLLDPTCGAGAFLVAAFDLLLPLRLAVERRRRDPAALGSELLESNLAGVDLSPVALEACRLRLLLRLRAAAGSRPPRSESLPLPDLSRRVCIGDALRDPLPAAEGGVDLLLANPPYREAHRAGPPPAGLRTSSCPNLCAWLVERGLRFLSPEGRLGVLLPVSAVSTAAFRPLDALFADRERWIGTFASRPARLFDGVEQRLALLVAGPRAARDAPTWTSAYQHWYGAERAFLFDRLVYCRASRWPATGMPIKTGAPEAERLFARLMACRARGAPGLGELFAPNGAEPGGAVWLHDAPTYWVRALSFPPDGTGHFHRIPTRSAEDARLLAAILSSTLFYFFFKAVGNGRDLGACHWREFPLEPLPEPERRALAALGEALEAILRATAAQRTRRYPRGPVRYTEYAPARARELIDRIDALLAAHYRLDAAEQAFLRSYDRKYRLGAAAAGE